MSFGKRARWLITLGAAVAVGGAVVFVAPWDAKGGANGKDGPTAEATAPGNDSGTSAANPAKKPTKALQPVTVTTELVTTRPVQRTVKIVGSLYGQEEIAVSAKIEGRVTRILHDVGDVVRPGDVLVEIDETDYRLSMNETQRALELELARLGLTELPTKRVRRRTLAHGFSARRPWRRTRRRSAIAP